MARPRRNRIRTTTLVGLALVGVFVTSALSMSLGPGHGVALHFGDNDGLAVQAGHVDTDRYIGEVEYIVTTVGDTVTNLELVKRYGTFGAEIEHELISASLSGSAADPESTTIRVGDDVVVTIGGVLEEVPEVEEPGLIAWLEETIQGFEPPDLVPDDPGPDPDPDQEIFTFPDDDAPVVTLIVWHGSDRAQLIVAPGSGLGALNILVEPAYTIRYGEDGRVVDLQVQDPVAAADVGGSRLGTPAIDISCDTTGHCDAIRGTEATLCDAPGGPCEDQHIAATTLHETDGLSHDGDTLLHLWADDAIDGQAYVRLGDNDPVQTSFRHWDGDPFSDEGLSASAPDGTELANLRLHVPTGDDPTVGFRLGGDIVEQVAPEDLAAEHELISLGVTVFVGPFALEPPILGPYLDLSSGLIVAAYQEADGTIAAIHINDAMSGGTLLAMVEEASDVQTIFEPLGSTMTWLDAEIGSASSAAVSDIDSVHDVAEGLTFHIVDTATAKALNTVAFTQDLVGCDLTPAGCLGIVIGAADALPTGAPPTPPDSWFVGDVALDGSKGFNVYVNTLAGWAIGLVPGDGDSGCLPQVAGTGQTCVDVEEAAGISAAMIGWHDETRADVLAYAEGDDEEIFVLRAGDDEIARVHQGHIEAGGVNARWSDGTMLELTGADGQRITVDSTITAATDLLTGTATSLVIDRLGEGEHWLGPHVRYQIDAHGDLASATVYDPQDEDATLLRYHDDAETTTISTAFEDVVPSRSFPSNQVTLTGDPVRSERWAIDLPLMTPKGGEGLYSQVEIVRTGYDLVDSERKGLPGGALTAVVFDLQQAPSSELRVGDGHASLLSTRDELDGSAWLSGLRANQYLVRTPMAADTAPRVEAVIGLGQVPTYGADLRFPLPLVGASDEAKEWLYQGSISAATYDGIADGATVYTALAWTERIGPIAFVAWDDAEGRGYQHKIDKQSPTATIEAPVSSEDPTFTVNWNSAGDTGSGLGWFEVQSAPMASPSSADWRPWIAGMRPTDGSSATFQTDYGTTHAFRARACDNVANCGAWSTTAITEVGDAPVDASASDANDAPQLVIESPADGATLSGLSEIAWRASDVDAGDVLVNAEYRRVGTDAWVLLYSGRALTTDWDTVVLTDGDYELRLSATDGGIVTSTTRTVTIQNGLVEPSLEQLRGHAVGAKGSGGAGAGADGVGDGPGAGDGEDGDRDTPAAPWVVVVAASIAGLVVVRRRSKGD